MGRTLKFTQTARYNLESEAFDALEDLLHRSNYIERDLSLLPGVTYEHTLVTRNHFPAPANCYDLRITFYVNKTTRITWDKIYETINRINPVYYSFI